MATPRIFMHSLTIFNWQICIPYGWWPLVNVIKCNYAVFHTRTKQLRCNIVFITSRHYHIRPRIIFFHFSQHLLCLDLKCLFLGFNSVFTSVPLICNKPQSRQRCPVQDSNRGLPKYKYKALPIHQSVLLLRIQ
jgi:hypothetical protein